MENSSYAVVCYSIIGVVVVGLFLLGLRVRDWWQDRTPPKSKIPVPDCEFETTQFSLRSEK